MLRALEAQGRDPLRQVVQSAADRIAQQHQEIAALPDAPARIRAALALLWEDAPRAELRPAGGTYEVILPDCPLASLAAEFNEICEITRGLLAALVGARVEQRQSLTRGDACCAFVLTPLPETAPAPVGASTPAKDRRGPRRGTHGPSIREAVPKRAG